MGDKTIPDSAEPCLESFYSSQVSIYHIKVKWIHIIFSVLAMEILQSCTKPSISGDCLNITMLSYQSHNHLIFNMRITIPWKDGLYIETGPWFVKYLLVLEKDLPYCVNCMAPDNLVTQGAKVAVAAKLLPMFASGNIGL